MRRGRRNGASGFTLIEMLVSLSIFAVVTGFVMANFRVGRQGDELRIAAQLVASGIRRAQTAAISGQTVHWCDGGTRDELTCNGGTDAECTGGGTCRRDVPAGFGMHFSSVPGERGRMTAFADIDGDGRYREGEEIRSDDVSSGPFVEIRSVAPDDTGVLDVVYSPPRPSVRFNAGTSQVTASVELVHGETGKAATVTVNAVSGQVNVK